MLHVQLQKQVSFYIISDFNYRLKMRLKVASGVRLKAKLD